MDYGRPDRADRLAAEYTLGTLRGAARRRFEQLLPSHPALARACIAWSQRLAMLDEPVPSIEPPERVWTAVQARVFAPRPAVTQPARLHWWQRVGAWRAVSVGALTAWVLSTSLWLAPRPSGPPIVIVMQGTAEGAGMTESGFVASVSADGSALVLRPVGAVRVSAGRALQLWALPVEGEPQSLGVLGQSATATVERAGLLQGTGGFAVSLEPAGGSPTGLPTGPIVSAGKL